MKKNILSASLLLLPFFSSGCTITITQTATDTHGWANDIVDETQKTESSYDTDLSVPMMSLNKI